jgi:hypothetical protein
VLFTVLLRLIYSVSSSAGVQDLWFRCHALNMAQFGPGCSGIRKVA